MCVGGGGGGGLGNEALQERKAGYQVQVSLLFEVWCPYYSRYGVYYSRYGVFIIQGIVSLLFEV